MANLAGRNREQHLYPPQRTADATTQVAGSIARARQTGTLALRSIADINMVENEIDDQPPKRGETVNVVRYGVPGSTTTQK